MKNTMICIKKTLPIYLIFFVTAFLSHFYFIESGNYFNEACCDSVKQISFFYPFLDKLIETGSLAWSFNYGLGGDVFGQFLYYYTASPFFWITALFFDINNLTDIFGLRLWISITKLTIAMVFMYHLLKYLKRSSSASILGSLVYGGSVYFTFYSLRYDFMVDGMVWLPLLLLGYERFLNESKRGLFLLSIFIVVSSNFYLAFINSIFLGLYAIYKYFIINEKLDIRGLISHLLRFMKQYTIGFLLAAFTFFPAVHHFFNVDRFYYDHQIPLIFSNSFYSAMPYELLFFGERLRLQISFPAVLAVLFAAGLFIRQKSVRVTLLFSAFIGFLALIPYSYSFFNGLSSIQYRWLYLFLFIVAYCTSFLFDTLPKRPTKREYVAVVVAVILLFITVKTKKYTVDSFASNRDLLVLSTVLFGAGLILLRSRIRPKVTAIGLVVAILAHQTLANGIMYTKLVGDPTQLKDAHENILSSSSFGHPAEQRMFNHLEETDTDFYRVVWNDQREINAPLIYGYNGISAYNSLLAGDVHRFIKKDYNTLQQNSPSLFKNVDNRMYIEAVLGVKYHLSSASEGFSKHGYSQIHHDDESDMDVYQNDAPMPIGFLYRESISHEEFEKLSYAERDELLLRAAVLEDKSEITKSFNTDSLSSQSIKIPVGKQNIEDIDIDNGKWTMQSHNSIEITNPFQHRKGELLVEIGVTRLDGQPFTIDVNQSSFQYLGDKNIYNYPKDTIVFNLGQLQSEENIRVHITPGEYNVSHLTLHFHSYEDFDRYVEAARSVGMTNVETEGRRVRGQINADESGILYLSIPYSPGWSAIVDGKQAEVLRVNQAFIGIPIDSGEHKVELTFTTPMLKVGIVVSLTTLILLIIMRFLKRKRTE